MKKIKLIFEIFWLMWRYIKTYRLRNCLEEFRTPKGTGCKLVRDERVDVVFVFGPREGIVEEVIKRAFPRAKIEFQCSEYSTIWPPHRLVGETVGAGHKNEMIVFINPWNADCGNQKIFGFDSAHLLGLLDKLVNEEKQRVVLASYEDNQIMPHASYFRELDEPHMILFRIKMRIKEFFTFKFRRAADFAPCCGAIAPPLQ